MAMRRKISSPQYSGLLSKLQICFNLIFRVSKTHKSPELIKLEWIKQIGLSHMRIIEGTTSLTQLIGLVSKLILICEKAKK